MDKTNKTTISGSTDMPDRKGLVDTDNDGKFRDKNDQSDHGDVKSPYSKLYEGEKNKPKDSNS